VKRAATHKGHLKRLGWLSVKHLDRSEGLTDPESRFSRVFVYVVVGHVEAIGGGSLWPVEDLTVCETCGTGDIWLVDQLGRNSSSIPYDIVKPIASI
jgi:hypothetical protein